MSFSTFQTQKLTSSRTGFHDCNCWIWSFYGFYVRKSANSCIPYSCENVVARRWVLVHSGLWSDWRLESNWARLVGSLLRLSWNPGLDPLWPRPPDDFVHFGGQRRLLEFWLLELKLWFVQEQKLHNQLLFYSAYMGSGGFAPSGVQGQSPWSGVRERSPWSWRYFLWSEYDQGVRICLFNRITGLSSN